MTCFKSAAHPTDLGGVFHIVTTTLVVGEETKSVAPSIPFTRDHPVGQVSILGHLQQGLLEITGVY